MSQSSKFRLITRSDFDGLVCAALLKEKELISEVIFAHPRDMQAGSIAVSKRDISTNLPYVPGIYLAFDHHSSESQRIQDKPENHIIEINAPSAARVVYNYYGGKETFINISDEMMSAVDKCDSAQFTEDDVINPQRWVLLNFLMDARTGLGRFREFRISNHQLMLELIDYCREHPIDRILEFEDVKERVDLYLSCSELFANQLKEISKLHGKVLYLNTRNLKTIYPGNRFLKYAFYPETNISIQELWGKNREKVVFTVGKSIFNKTSPHNVGEIMLSYGGGGHKNAGTCQIDINKADIVRKELIEQFA